MRKGRFVQPGRPPLVIVACGLANGNDVELIVGAIAFWHILVPRDLPE